MLDTARSQALSAVVSPYQTWKGNTLCSFGNKVHALAESGRRFGL